MAVTNKHKVLVPNTMGSTGTNLLRAREDVEVVLYPTNLAGSPLHELLHDAEGISLSVTPFGEAEMQAAPRMRVIARIGVGYDAVEVPALTKRRVPLMVTGIANSVSVAEQAVFFILHLAKRGAVMDTMVREGRWDDRFKMLPVEICGKTALVVGFGRIGVRAAKRCAALEMNVLVYDPYVPPETIRSAGHEPMPDLDVALSRADFVTIHCPKTPETIGLFNAMRLARMKPGSFLVNTARGGIIDEPALHAALTSGHLAGAGLDVFDLEPTPTTNALLKLDSVVTSPHMAGVTGEAQAAMAEACARNILSVIDGQPIVENVINKEVLP
jgi:D-3-phosphoglycerate dehydrogenase